jgi:23S rRNA (adenine2503-C2)-methyltransferase
VARKIYKQVMQRGVFEPETLGLGSEASRAWREHFRLALPRVARTVGEDTALGTVAKAVLATHDGLEFECVLLPMGRDRSTLCVSSQVGCKMGCTFCETGRMGLLRSLSVAEIVGELLVARHVLGWTFNNVVFMGMGEALDNADALFQVLRVMTDGVGMSFSQERITVCTVGRIDGIARLAELGMKRLNLSISLNAANDALRSQLMPVNRTVKLAQLQEALLAYRPRANFALGVNYCLLPGINDSRADASEIAAFCAPLGRVMVNVIPYNPGTAPIASAPGEDGIERFIGWLRDEGLPVRRRITKGRSVMAACGQLGNVELRALRKKERAASNAQ